MSELEQAIEGSLRRALESAPGLDGSDSPDTYPGGKEVWVKRIVGLRMDEIRQWLHDPKDVQSHLDSIR